MKIIISANSFWTIVNFRRGILESLVSRGDEVICIGEYDNLSQSSMQFLNDYNIKYYNINIDRRGINPFKDIRYLFFLIKIYKNEKPSIILHYTIKPNIYGSIAAKILAIPTISTINGLGSSLMKDNLFSKIMLFMYKLSLKNIKKVLFQNNTDRNYFITNEIVESSNSGTVNGSGVDIEHFKNTNIFSNEKSFLMVCRLLKDKGVFEYIQAIKFIRKNKKYSNIQFYLAGQYENEDIQEKDVKQWEEDGLIHYLGTTNDIRDFFNLVNIVVLPSYREGLSKFLCEAGAYNLPAITTDVVGCRDVIIDNYNGMLCNVKDYKSLAERMIDMIELEKEKFQEMQQASRKCIEDKFDQNIIIQEYLKIINNFAGEEKHDKNI